MYTVSVSEARKTLCALLDGIEIGKEVLITRRGKPIARIVSLESSIPQAEARLAAQGLLAASKGLTLGGLSLKQLVAEGRR